MASSNMMQCYGKAAKRMLLTARPFLIAANPFAGTIPIFCGRGDNKTKKGKRFKGSYGNARPKKEKMIQRIKVQGRSSQPMIQS